MSEEEYTEGGSHIKRYEKKEFAFNSPDSDDNSTEEIERHIEKYVGTPAMVYHELVSEHVHIDIHVVYPTRERNYYTLITSGMSDKPMDAPFDGLNYSELMVCLPPDWKMSEEDFKDENNYWILRWLKMLARFPHQYETWLWNSHTIPNGDPPQRFARNTKMCCALISVPVLFDYEFTYLEIREGKTINFHSIIPIYKEEMKYKLKHGIEEMDNKFYEAGVTELLDVSRKNTCKKLFGIF